MTKRTTRRSFLKTSSAAASAGLFVPYFFSSAPTLAFETRSPNDKVNIGLIGAGGMGRGNIGSAKGMDRKFKKATDPAKDWVNLVAIADPDSKHRDIANKQLGDGKADLYDDYQKILERDDINVLHIATPDHWHTKPLIEAMYAGKDIYCEKPLTLTIDEGKLIRKVQKETGRIVQVGTQQRSSFKRFPKAVAIAAEGRLGKIKKITCGIDGAPSSPAIPVVDTPDTLDWDRWLGPAPKVDYRYFKQPGKGRNRTKSNCHYEFRWWYEYSGGKLTDWGAHHVDIAMWALAANGQSNKLVSIEGDAEHPVEFEKGKPTQTDRYNTATKFTFKAMMDDGVELIITSEGDNGLLIEGEKGRIFCNRGKLVGKPVEDLAGNPLPEDAIQKVYKGLPMVENDRRQHWANFLYCVDKRVEPISDVTSHMKMLNVCHLAGICARLGRKIEWDDATESITGDDLANSMLARPYREGYEIKMAEMVS